MRIRWRHISKRSAPSKQSGRGPKNRSAPEICTFPPKDPAVAACGWIDFPPVVDLTVAQVSRAGLRICRKGFQSAVARCRLSLEINCPEISGFERQLGSRFRSTSPNSGRKADLFGRLGGGECEFELFGTAKQAELHGLPGNEVKECVCGVRIIGNGMSRHVLNHIGRLDADLCRG